MARAGAHGAAGATGVGACVSPNARPVSLLRATLARLITQVGHSWRTGRDLFAVWDEHGARDVLRLPEFLQSFMTAVEGQHDYADFAGPGAFNDPDMLVVGLEGMVPYGLVRQTARTRARAARTHAHTHARTHDARTHAARTHAPQACAMHGVVCSTLLLSTRLRR